VAREQIGASRAHHHDWTGQVLEQVAQKIDGILVGVVEVFEDEAQGAVRCVDLDERFDDCPPHQPSLLRVVRHRARQRTLVEVEPEQLPDEIDDVPDLPVFQHFRDLRADLRLGGVFVHALDQAKAHAEEPRKHAERRDAVASATSVHPWHQRAVAVLDDEILN